VCIEYPPEITLCNKRRHFFFFEQNLYAVHHIFFNESEFAGLNLAYQLLVDIRVAVETHQSEEILIISYCCGEKPG